MKTFVSFIEALVDSLPQPMSSPDSGALVRAIGVELTLPIEGRIARDGLHASLPRGRLATGFSLPLGRVFARFAVREIQEPVAAEREGEETP